MPQVQMMSPKWPSLVSIATRLLSYAPARCSCTGFTTARTRNRVAVLNSFSSRRWMSLEALDAAKGGRERVVVLGSGWGGFPFARNLDSTKYQTVVISPRSYFVFTPLLASTAVGTLEFRTTVEPVRKLSPKVEYFECWADDVDLRAKKVRLEDAVTRTATDHFNNAHQSHGHAEDSVIATQSDSQKPGLDQQKRFFDFAYDKLVIAVGCYSQTFGLPGAKENAFFLKDVGDARRIRRRILQCFEAAALPTTSEDVARQLLHFAIVGGGPTGIEFAAELHDLVRDDLNKVYPSVAGLAKITVFDVAPNVLSMFDSVLSEYAVETFRREGIEIKTEHHVETLTKGLPRGIEDESDTVQARSLAEGYTLRTKEDGNTGLGICVWSTGLMMNPFVEKAFAKPSSLTSDVITSQDPAKIPSEANWAVRKHGKSGAILTDDRFRVLISQGTMAAAIGNQDSQLKDVFAIGDVAAMESAALPATAQVANQKALWLAKRLNQGDLDTNTFTFRNLGVMAYLGNWKAIMQGGNDAHIKGQVTVRALFVSVSCFNAPRVKSPQLNLMIRRAAWVLWRTAYLTMAVSWRNKILIPIYWTINWLTGRDLTRF